MIIPEVYEYFHGLGNAVLNDYYGAHLFILVVIVLNFHNGLNYNKTTSTIHVFTL